ncbi:MAG: hypothetical protein ACLUD2_08705 [Clostridium sp.]
MQELVMELRADCPEEDRLVVGGNDWGYLKVIQIKGGHLRARSSVVVLYRAVQTGIWESAETRRIP